MSNFLSLKKHLTLRCQHQGATGIGWLSLTCCTRQAILINVSANWRKLKSAGERGKDLCGLSLNEQGGTTIFPLPFWHKWFEWHNKRGAAEQWIKEGKNAIRWTRLSCHGFKQNAVRLQLFALAYNLANFMRTSALTEEIKHWSLTTLREKLIKIGTKVVARSRYLTFQMAEVAVPKQLFAMILSRIRSWRLAPA